MNNTTIARPYAIAIFSFAIEHKNVEHWQNMLLFAEKVATSKQMINLISRTLTPAVLSTIFNEVCNGYLDKFAQNLIKLMAENKRLSMLSIVLNQFIELKISYEKIIIIDVTSSEYLSQIQLTKINVAMERRLLHKVRLNCKIDKSIIGGMIIRSKNLIINGSIRDRIDRLSNILEF